MPTTNPISLACCQLPTLLVSQLELQGYQLTDSAQGWVGLVDLSHCSASEIAQRLAACQCRHRIALVEPEQSEIASAAMELGAQDYLLLPLDGDQLVNLLKRLVSLEQDQNAMVAVSAKSRQTLMLAQRAAQTDASVLLTGESGTGKEQVSRFIHRQSPRSGGPFIAVNCAAIPESMLESLLFGHVKGAFTGAHADKAGTFEAANGGTLLLDEIAEMPLMLQAKLLRVLQERSVERLGSHKTIPLDIRVIAATNQDLAKAVAEGRFREDLFYRLDVLPLKLLPLRERREDILPLAEFFLTRFKELTGPDGCHFSEPARMALMAHDWPGNVRELENTVQRALVLRRGQTLQLADLGLPQASCASVAVMPVESESGLKASKRQAEFQYVLDTLRRHGGNRSKTAEALSMTTRSLRYKMAQMREAGIDVDAALAATHAA
ncbi:sigma-54 dependent transcriptional regulator [Ferrimonas marina]|uniref:DNA-binding transcriptional response regulator, NtrC family, contains REC, AAA-type ATPase, and a Fis-type DNA-binding domains n=1 Tax=Ferrimonas marina TaxID=299255 RepID=A0A1M5R1L3_9GAMM|nr:sigma-54 dependent transcriptional regulator [Ferrimonas marina]SHH19996.1 DNA-binding transcriptional response regulator, NtrC family, contains REC, AAA-type ATPase, and a Fis-type DNA-binding domains [Ferrimonas marina]